MRKSWFFATLLVLISLFVLAGASQVLAKPHHHKDASISTAPVTPPGLPANSILVLDITLQVINDEDSGFFGYWALDSYTKEVRVWQVPAGTFYAEVRYEGKWKTFKNAASPGLGMTQERDDSGPMKGGYVATFAFAGAFNPGAQKIKGYIGKYDLGGTKTDILTGSTAQTGPTTPFSVLTAYFPGYNNFVYQSWGWTYTNESRDADQNWYNFDRASIGDILTE